MYSDCFACDASLGSNPLLSTFPIGGRIAFDSAERRIWVVCPRCQEWNLAPPEESKAALSEVESCFAKATTTLAAGGVRVATAGPLQLIQLWSEERSLIAASRFRRVLERRRTQAFTIWATATLSLLVAVGISAPMLARMAPISAVAAVSGLCALAVLLRNFSSARRRLRIRTIDGGVLTLSRREWKTAGIRKGERGDWFLEFRRERDLVAVCGVEARDVLAQLLARINKTGASAPLVKAALGRLEAAGGSDRYLKALATFRTIHKPLHQRFAQWVLRRGTGLRPLDAKWLDLREARSRTFQVLSELAPIERIAAEIAVNERKELLAARTAAAPLAARWFDAENRAIVGDKITERDSSQQ